MTRLRHSATVFHVLPLTLAAFTLLGSTGCSLNIKVGQIPSTKTELEEQVLGAYREIDDELIMISTVRSGEASATANQGGLDERVRYARQNQKFNLDDIEELKNAQLLGEAADGSLVMVPSSANRLASQPANQLRLAQLLLAEENADRALIWQEILTRQANPDASQLGEVRKAFATLKHKECKVGQWYQTASGEWVRKINDQS